MNREVATYTNKNTNINRSNIPNNDWTTPVAVENVKKVNLLLRSLKALYFVYDVERDNIIIDNIFANRFEFDINNNISLSDLENKHSFIYSADASAFYKEINKTINKKFSNSFFSRLQFKKDESYKWCELTANVINDEDESCKLLITIQDVFEDLSSMRKYIYFSDQFECEASENLASFILNLSQNSLEKIVSSTDYNYKKEITADMVFDHVKSNILGKFNIDKHLKYHNRKNLLKMYKEGKTNFSYLTNYFYDNKVYWVKHVISLARNPINDDLMSFHAIKDMSEGFHADQILDYVVKNHFDFLARISIKEDVCNLIAGPRFAPEKSKQRYTFKIEEYIKRIYSHIDLETPTVDEYLSRLKSKLKDDGNFEYYLELKVNGKMTRKQINLYQLNDYEKSIIIACSDITALSNADKARNEVLSHTLNLANQANQAKSTFLSAMSHDIRTPINAIVGMTNLALFNLEDKFQVAQSFRVIKDSSFHLLALINEILEMSVIESGKYLTKKEPVNIVDLLTKVVDRLNPIAKKKKINISFDNKITNPYLLSDYLSLSRIVENIASNAIKFTPENGNVSICANDFQSGINNNNLLTIQIKDSGIGIADDKKNKIFDSFYRTGNASKGGIEGTGLGLSITKGLVDSMGGSITVQSEEQKGTTFKIVIPVRRAESTKLRNPTHLEEMKRDETLLEKNNYDKLLENKNVLLFEDHPINALVAKKMIIHLGARVSLAKDGLDGVNIFKNSAVNYFDVIFMDISMPNVDGYEATKMIRDLDRKDAQKTPIIAMTANAFANDVEKCLESGMNAHMSKPIKMSDLAAKVNKFVN